MRHPSRVVTATLARCTHQPTTPVRRSRDIARMVLAFALWVPTTIGFAQQTANVQWHASAQIGANTQERLVRLDAVIPTGWHVYGITQSEGGPTPLVIRIEKGAPFEISGVPHGTLPQRHHDASFDLDTEYLTQSLELDIPIRVVSSASTSDIPLSVRYQMCSDSICLPPKTIHLIAKSN